MTGRESPHQSVGLWPPLLQPVVLFQVSGSEVLRSPIQLLTSETSHGLVAACDMGK